MITNVMDGMLEIPLRKGGTRRIRTLYLSGEAIGENGLVRLETLNFLTIPTAWTEAQWKAVKAQIGMAELEIDLAKDPEG